MKITKNILIEAALKTCGRGVESKNNITNNIHKIYKYGYSKECKQKSVAIIKQKMNTKGAKLKNHLSA